MADQPIDFLQKIMGHIDSPHDGEALSALRLCQKALAPHGMTFAGLVQRLRECRAEDRVSADDDSWRARAMQAEERLQALSDALAQQKSEPDHARLQVRNVYQRLNTVQAESDRWRAQAAEWADRLWAMGCAADTEQLSQTDSHDDGLTDAAPSLPEPWIRAMVDEQRDINAPPRRARAR